MSIKFRILISLSSEQGEEAFVICWNYVILPCFRDRNGFLRPSYSERKEIKLIKADICSDACKQNLKIVTPL